MSCSCCYNKAVDPVATHHLHSPSCHIHRQQLMNYVEDTNHHCCSSSPSYRHLPIIASPLHISHAPHPSHSPHPSHTPHPSHVPHPHCPNHSMDVFHTSPSCHHRAHAQPHSHTCHGRRELIPSPTTHCGTAPSSMGYARPLPQTPLSVTRPPSFVHPSTQVEFSPVSSNGSPNPSSSGFKLAYVAETPLDDPPMSESVLEEVSKATEFGGHVGRSRRHKLISERRAGPLHSKLESMLQNKARKRRDHYIEISDDTDSEVAPKARSVSRDLVPSPTRMNEQPSSKAKNRHPETNFATERASKTKKESDAEAVFVVESEEESIPLPAVVQSVETSREEPASTVEPSQEVREPDHNAGVDSEGQTEPVVLVKWFLDILPPEHIVLLGYKDQDLETENPEIWRTGPIVNRLSSRLLQTERGTTYFLKGSIDRASMGPGSDHGQSLSRDTVEKFRRGFPRSWRALLTAESKEFTPDPPTPVIEEVKTEVKVEPSSFHTPSVSISDTSISSGFLCSLKRSSRGRTLKPSMTSLSPYLQASTNIYSYDVYGNFQGFALPTIDLTLSDVEELTPSKPKRRVKREAIKKEDEELVLLHKTKGMPTPKGKPHNEENEGKLKEATKTPQKKVTPSNPPVDVVRPLKESQGSVDCQTSHNVIKPARKGQHVKVQSSSLEQIDPSTAEEAKDKGSEVRTSMYSLRSKGDIPRNESTSANKGSGSSSSVTSRSKSRKETMPESRKSSDTCTSVDPDPPKDKKVACKTSGSKMLSRKKRAFIQSSSEESDVEGLVQSARTCADEQGKSGDKEAVAKTGAQQLRRSLRSAKASESDQESSTQHHRSVKKTQASESAAIVKRGKRRTERNTQTVKVPPTSKHDSPAQPPKPTTPASVKIKKKNRVTMVRRPRKPRLTPDVSGGRGSGRVGGEVTEEEEDEDGWTPQQVTLLKRITREVPALAPNYWEEVANRMSTRHTARDCSSKYMDVCTRPPTKRPVRQKQPGPRDEEQGDKKIVISGRAGTLKRKRQLRAAMEHMDKDYVDDIFDSTPFKKRVKTVVKIPDLSEFDESSSSSSEAEEEGGEIETVTPNPARRRVGAPHVHTPKLCDLITTLDLKSRLNRNAADNVMHQIQKAKKPKSKPSAPHNPPAPSKPPTKVHFTEQKLRNIRTGEMRTFRMFEDSDEDESEDYPFSDLDEAYRL